MLLSRHCALVGLVPCYACRVPVGTPYSLSYCYHGIAPLWSLYRVICIVSLLGCPTDYYTGIMFRPDRDETLRNTVQEDRVLAVP